MPSWVRGYVPSLQRVIQIRICKFSKCSIRRNARKKQKEAIGSTGWG